MSRIPLLICLGMLIGCTAAFSAEPPSHEVSYSAKAINFQIVDSETKQPLPGVAVVAHWQVAAGLPLEASSKLLELKVLEATSDIEGRVHFAAWGPEANPSPIGYVQFADPEMFLFLSGYKAERLENRVTTEPRSGSVRYSDWDGKVVAMDRLPATPAVRYNNFMRLNSQLHWVTSEPSSCLWWKIPSMLRAVHEQTTVFRSQGMTTPTKETLDESLISDADHYAKEGGQGCKSPLFIFKKEASK